MLHYVCFCYPFVGRDFAGQKNLSRPLERELSSRFHPRYRAVSCPRTERMPSVFRVLAALHRLHAARMVRRLVDGPSGSPTRPRGVTVVDLMHSVVALPAERYYDRIVLVGHDSYALRALRDLRFTPLGVAIARKVLSFVAWSYVEFLFRLASEHQFFVSPIDRRFAGMRGASSVVGIPVSPSLLPSIRKPAKCRNIDRLRVVVSVPVISPNQNRFDAEAILATARVFAGRADITVWGRAAAVLKRDLDPPAGLRFVERVDDYPAFLGGFDLLVYPRVIGSGFHTKLAEAMALGVHCFCVDWIAEALAAWNHSDVSTFSGPEDFEARLRSCRQAWESGAPEPRAADRGRDAPCAPMSAIVSMCARLVEPDSASRPLTGA